MGLFKLDVSYYLFESFLLMIISKKIFFASTVVQKKTSMANVKANQMHVDHSRTQFPNSVYRQTVVAGLAHLSIGMNGEKLH